MPGDLRTFDIPPCPDDLERVADAEGSIWRRHPNRRKHWKEAVDFGMTANWRTLVTEYGPLKEARPMPEIRYPFTEAGLREALEALGTTADAVATNLLAMGFTGRANEPLCCPVANYLRKSVTGAITACVGKDDNGALFAQVEAEGGTEDVGDIGVPKAVTSFVFQFDAERFPDLIEEGLHAR